MAKMKVVQLDLSKITLEILQKLPPCVQAFVRRQWFHIALKKAEESVADAQMGNELYLKLIETLMRFVQEKDLWNQKPGNQNSSGLGEFPLA